MTTETLRRNASKKIRAILEGCALITEYRYDDMISDCKSQVTADYVMDADSRYKFDHVYQDEETISAGIHGNWFFTGYKTIDAARRRLTPQAFAKYFPQQVAA